MKLIAIFVFLFRIRTYSLSGRTGTMFLAIIASILGGGISFRRNARHTCTAIEKFALYTVFLLPDFITIKEVMISAKLYMTKAAYTS